MLNHESVKVLKSFRVVSLDTTNNTPYDRWIEVETFDSAGDALEYIRENKEENEGATFKIENCFLCQSR